MIPIEITQKESRALRETGYYSLLPDLAEIAEIFDGHWIENIVDEMLHDNFSELSDEDIENLPEYMSTLAYMRIIPEMIERLTGLSFSDGAGFHGTDEAFKKLDSIKVKLISPAVEIDNLYCEIEKLEEKLSHEKLVNNSLKYEIKELGVQKWNCQNY